MSVVGLRGLHHTVGTTAGARVTRSDTTHASLWPASWPRRAMCHAATLGPRRDPRPLQLLHRVIIAPGGGPRESRYGRRTLNPARDVVSGSSSPCRPGGDRRSTSDNPSLKPPRAAADPQGGRPPKSCGGHSIFPDGPSRGAQDAAGIKFASRHLGRWVPHERPVGRVLQKWRTLRWANPPVGPNVDERQNGEGAGREKVVGRLTTLSGRFGRRTLGKVCRGWSAGAQTAPVGRASTLGSTWGFAPRSGAA